YEHGTFKYHLTGITNENRLRYVSWDYNPQRRAILSRRAGQQGQPDEIVQLDFSYLNDGAAPRIIEINPHGKETIYHFEEVAGLRLLSRIEGKPHTHADIPEISCAPAHQYYQHDANGFLSTVTDWEGNVTRYERDAFGRELQRTEGLRWADGVVGTALQGYESARVTITRWHPRWNHPVRKLAAAQVTDRQYDCDSGLVLAERRYARGAEPAYVAPVCSPPE
ncbi:MAG: hypothetical protein WBN40_10945, partial [Pseudomonadales bacterium]